MARGTSGIDQQVTALADAYRNNPAALQKNYKVNQDLLDLLALQKIKSEKDAAAREIAMSQDPESKTVAEERADEAVGRSKKALLEQVGGIAQLQNRKGQQNLQRMAAGAPPANQPAQMTGIANQPAPNMVRMAKGGIVSFAGPEGSEVKSPTPEELLREAGFQGDIQEFYNLPREKQQRVLATLNDIRSAQRPGMDASAGAYLLDVLSLPVQEASSLVHRSARALGIMNPDQAGWQEGKQWSATKHLGKVAADPMNQPVSMSDIIPPVANRQPPGNIYWHPPYTTTPYTGPDITGTFDPAAPTDPTVNPNQNIPNRSLPVPSMGAEDTTAVADFVTPQTRIAKERNFELDQVEAQMRKGLSGLETRMGQDATTAGATAQGAADVHLNRKGVAAAHRDMLAREEAFQKSQEAARRPWLDVLAGARGAGAFADIGRSAAFGRREAAMGRERDFRGLQSLRQGQLDADLNIAKESLAAGQKTEELTQSDINNATTNHRAVMADLAGSISEKAERALKIGEANMNAEQFEAQIRFDKALAKLKSSTQLRVAEFTGKIRARGQDVQLRAIDSDDREVMMQAIEATDQIINNIKAGIQEQIADELAKDMAWIAMEEPEKSEYRAKKERDMNDAFQAQIDLQQGYRKRMVDRLEGSMVRSGVDPVNEGFGLSTQTSQ